MNFNNNKPSSDIQTLKLFSREMTALVQSYVRPILFGDLPISSDEPSLKGGTVTFVKTSKRSFGITNYHVVQGFRKAITSNRRVHCQLDELFLNINDRVIDEDHKLDIAILEISESESEIRSIGAIPFCPSVWPPKEPKVGDLVIIVGYPGQLRTLDYSTQVTVPHIGFIMPITSVSDTKISIQFERQHWITDKGCSDPAAMSNYGGISGSGVFAIRLTAELVGIEFEYNEAFGILSCSRTDFIQNDGNIKRQLI